MHQFLIITQQEVVGNSYDRYPTLFRNLVVNAALIAIVIGDIRYITAGIADFLKNFVYIRLLLFYRQIAVVNGKHDIT